ncbi:sensor histidine kinase [Streptacidiphilus albus]|uniref:sensor histidine kinase n=1 Tax=Streptacidiphilus albus TaxID=105425 RepID=UPI0007C877D2|nr:sensor histidine kinase [Streptacidiphilus albus]
MDDRAGTGASGPPAPRRPGPGSLLADPEHRRRRALPYAGALLLTLLLALVGTRLLTHSYGLGGALAVGLAVAQAAPLLLGVARPMAAWLLMTAADAVGSLVLASAPGLAGNSWPWPSTVLVGQLVLLLALTRRASRRTLLAAWLTIGAAGFALGLIHPHDRDGTDTTLFVFGGVVLLVGGALRERGDALRRLVAQERISAEERSRRTLLEERTRIARELHDVVAHHMSVITVQADSAPYRIGGLPPEAREEFGSLAATARESLTEMRRLLGVLRSEEADGERAPQPALARVPLLVAATVRAGLPAELRLDGPGGALGDLPQAVELSGYRIVQEALANVVRHAPGAPTRVSVTVSEDRSQLTVLVVNGAPARPAEPLERVGTGHGLVGMGERVRLVGGTLETGPLPGGGFRVAARIPLTAPAVPAEDTEDTEDKDDSR